MVDFVEGADPGRHQRQKPPAGGPLAGGHEPAAARAQEIRPSAVAVDEAVLTNLQTRLAQTRWPHQIPDTKWEYGVDLAYMKALTVYWQKGYDWRKQERALNALP